MGDTVCRLDRRCGFHSHGFFRRERGRRNLHPEPDTGSQGQCRRAVSAVGQGGAEGTVHGEVASVKRAPRRCQLSDGDLEWHVTSSPELKDASELGLSRIWWIVDRKFWSSISILSPSGSGFFSAQRSCHECNSFVATFVRRGKSTRKFSNGRPTTSFTWLACKCQPAERTRSWVPWSTWWEPSTSSKRRAPVEGTCRDWCTPVQPQSLDRKKTMAPVH